LESDCPLLSDAMRRNVFMKMNANIKHRKRSPNIWEFLVRLLISFETNPALVCWEQKDKYRFKLIQPKLISNLWSSRSKGKSSKEGSYSNFARALRYWYSQGGLELVEDRQLIYQLGPLGIKYIKELQ
ncbi:unnamed protein product, partial [Meganyctiphanes norvegica]